MGSRSDIRVKWLYKTPKAPLKICPLQREVTTEHPLKSVGIPISDKRTLGLSLKESYDKKQNIKTDPLSVSPDVCDPLSLMAAEMEWDAETPTPNKEPQNEFSFGLKPWAEQRSAILNKFTTSQKLSMSSSYLSGVDKSSAPHHNPIVRHRLEQLDYFEEGTVKEVGQLTQQQYTDSINQLSRELVQAWNKDSRVKALKITIQCSKLLVDTSVLQFYPSKFFLITDILDIFGSLVYERLKSKADSQTSRSKDGETNNSESALETCRNWFYKIASIRELVPRLYVEAAILKSYSFLTNKEFSEALARLTNMVRGIGDPLVAIYARCYLCHVGMSVSTINRQFLKDNFYDFLSVYHQMYGPYVKRELEKQKVDLVSYLEVHAPAIDWILHGLSHKAPDSLLDEIVERCSKIKNNGLLLNSIMNNFKPNYVAMRADRFIYLISISSDGIPQFVLLQTLGDCLQHHLVENPQNILEKAWKLISKFSITDQYMTCTRVWAVFIVKNFSHEKINQFLGDIIIRIGADGKKYSQILQNIITTIIINISDIEKMFMMDKLLPVLDLFETESEKVFVCRKILQVLASKQGFVSTDPVTNDALLYITKILHDSVNSLTVEDEKKQIGVLISTTIKQINFGKDFERQLDFYVDARATFTNIDTILSTLVYCVNNLAMETGRIVKSVHTRKTGPFVHACAAYCFITIPSIDSHITKLQLYLLTAQVAVFNQCLGQANACIKAALNLVLDLPSTIDYGLKEKSTEPFLSEYICNMLSTLIVIPDNTNQGIMYLTRALVNTLNHSSKEQNAAVVTSLFLNVLDMLSTCARPTYPYHVKRVDSNDVFYGSDPKFIDELDKMGSVVVDEIFNYLKFFGANNHCNKQARLAFDLFVRVILHTDTENAEMTALALNLWNLAHRHGSLDPKFASNTVEYLKGRTLFSSSMVQNEL